MLRIAVLFLTVSVNALSIPAVASECDAAASRAAINSVRSQQVGPGDREQSCRTYAASFYRIVLTRQAAAACGVGRQRELTVLDSEINALNDLLASRCGGG